MGHIRAVRVPWYLSVLLLIGVPATVWIVGTRRMDFLAPPSAAELEIARQVATVAEPSPQVQPPAASGSARVVDNRPPQRISTRPPTPAQLAERNPPIDSFADLAGKGVAHLIELSSLVAAIGDRQRELLLWERVIDSAKASGGQTDEALAAEKRLRQQVPAGYPGLAPVPLLVVISAPPKYEEALRPLTEKIAAELGKAAHGVLAPEVRLEIVAPPEPAAAAPVAPAKKGRKSGSRQPKTVTPPVTVVLAGAAPGASATAPATASFRKTEELQPELLRQIFKLAYARLAADKDGPGASPIGKGESPVEALSFRITRLGWRHLALALNQPAPPAEPAEK